MIFGKQLNINPISQEVKGVMILNCKTNTGEDIIYLAEHISYNTLSHLDTKGIPLKCYRIDNIFMGSIIIRTDSDNIVHLHLDKLLSYTNVTRNYIIMSQADFGSLVQELCDSCEHLTNYDCKLSYKRGGDSCENYLTRLTLFQRSVDFITSLLFTNRIIKFIISLVSRRKR